MKTTARYFFGFVMMLFLGGLAGCDNNDPAKEDVPEMITEITLIFSDGQGSVVTATATDPDGDGPQGLVVNRTIELAQSTTYTLKITLLNTLAASTSEQHDITAEVAKEADDHMFFFGWTSGLFDNPGGDGNIASRNGLVNYSGGNGAVDSKNLPLGLTTTWTTASSVKAGEFRIMLKHVPAIKTDETGADVGETDLDVTFDLVVI